MEIHRMQPNALPACRLILVNGDMITNPWPLDSTETDKGGSGMRTGDRPIH
jgi:hypothetical protein